MTFLQLGEIEKALKSSPERCLKTISFREEAEKKYVWYRRNFREKCLAGLVRVYGLIYYSYKNLLGIYEISEKSSTKQPNYSPKATALNLAARKFSIWVSSEGPYQSVTISRLSQVCSIRICKRVTQKGSVIIRVLVADAPKRIDLWVYVDQEVKAKDQKKVEDLFEI
nr:BPK_HP1_G0043990.mRNA.1.CDS.1 [Saccharomyces cerevisiae]